MDSDRLIDRVLDPRYVEGLASLSDDELRHRLVDAEEMERETSAVRRQLHRIISELQGALEGRPSAPE